MDEVGFKKFDTPLTLGNYVPWTDLYRVLGYIYALLSIITILVSSIVFSDDNSKNINQILLVTKYGRNKMIFAKLIATSIITVSLFIIFQLVNIGVFSTMYDMSGWNSDILPDTEYTNNELMKVAGVLLGIGIFLLALFGVLSKKMNYKK